MAQHNNLPFSGTYQIELSDALITPAKRDTLLKTLLRRGFEKQDSYRLLKMTYPREHSHHDNLMIYLREQFQQQALVFHLLPGDAGISMLIPIASQQRINSYARIAHQPEQQLLLEHETAILQSLHQSVPDKFLYPIVRDSLVWNGLFISLYSLPQSLTVLPPDVDLIGEYTPIWQQLATLHQRRMQLEWSGFWRQLTLATETIRHHYYKHLVQSAFKTALQRSQGTQLLFHMAHGRPDRHTLLYGNARLFLHSWEHSQMEAPVGWDMIHLHIQEGIHQDLSAHLLYRSFQRDGAAFRIMQDCLHSMGIRRNIIPTLLILYLANQLTDLADNEATADKDTRYLAILLNTVLQDVRQPEIP